MTAGLNCRPKEWSRPPELHPPDAGCWCSRNQRRPYVSLIWCGTPSGHRDGLRPWIRTNGWGTANDLNPTLDFKRAHVSSHSLAVIARSRLPLGRGQSRAADRRARADTGLPDLWESSQATASMRGQQRFISGAPFTIRNCRPVSAGQGTLTRRCSDGEPVRYLAHSPGRVSARQTTRISADQNWARQTSSRTPA